MAKSFPKPPREAAVTAPPPDPAEVAETGRRNLVVAGFATLIGGIISLFPFGAGLLVFLDPILKTKPKAAGKTAGTLRRISTKDAVPADGTPVQVPVIADQKDAWSLEANQPIGAVYLRNVGGKIECFNAICPHAGCFVAYSADRKCFQCPCHTSAFELDGSRKHPSPSPRDMDGLVVDAEKLAATGEVWVDFVNYYPGKETQEPKT